MPKVWPGLSSSASSYSTHHQLTQGYLLPRRLLAPVDKFRNIYPPCHSRYGVVPSSKPWYQAIEVCWGGRGKLGKKGSRDVGIWCVGRVRGFSWADEKVCYY